MIKYVYLVLALSLFISLIGCNDKSNVPIDMMNSSGYYHVAQEFLKQENSKIITNSMAAAEIRLPNDFSVAKDGVNVGELLEQRNELSKRSNLDFSKYMGQEVIIYTAAFENETDDIPKSIYEVVLLIWENKVVGYWIDDGMKDHYQNQSDFIVLVNLLL